MKYMLEIIKTYLQVSYEKIDHKKDFYVMAFFLYFTFRDKELLKYFKNYMDQFIHYASNEQEILLSLFIQLSHISDEEMEEVLDQLFDFCENRVYSREEAFCMYQNLIDSKENDNYHYLLKDTRKQLTDSSKENIIQKIKTQECS